MKDLFRSLQENPVCKDAFSALADGRRLVVSGLEASAKEFILAAIAGQIQKPVLYIVKGPKEQDSAAGNLGVFTPAPVHAFPPIDIIPGQGVHPQVEITAERVCLLYDLLTKKDPRPVIIATAHSITQSVIPPVVLRGLLLSLRTAMAMSMRDLAGRLAALGYEPSPMVEKKGDFSMRGGVVDIYAITSDDPYRVEFFGDTIESIRQFDVTTQKSICAADAATIAPCVETPFFDAGRNATVLEYFDDCLVVYDEFFDIRDAVDQFSADLKDEKIFLPFYVFREKAAGCQEVFFNLMPQRAEEFAGAARVDIDVRRIDAVVPPAVPVQREKITESRQLFLNTQDAVLKEMARLVDEDYTLTVVCNNEGEKERYTELVREKGVVELDDVPVALGRLNTGFIMPSLKLAFVADQDVFNRYKIRPLTRRFKGVNPLGDLTEIKSGDFVVHINFGIGKYRGLNMIEKDGLMREFLTIEYADRAVLHVPIENINLVERYIGLGTRPTLDRLGTARWKNVKKRVEIATAGIAADLLEVQAAREMLDGIPHAADTPWQREFESAFIYEETPDQIRTIEEVKADMESRRPMDRLICGDVGYGKTEVAVRAAFKAVMDNRQVAVLVPTTILADQHYRTFGERMKDYPVKVEMLSRFKTKREQKQILEELRDGRVNIVIGTHRLLQKDIALHDLGLVIIDEEQRFGVRHKEKFKQLRKLVDVLTLTATPIPRTLYLSLLGVKEMSTINTPPENRLPIETYIIEYDEAVIRKAVVHELAREGQVFFVHNRVGTIDRMKERLQKLVPEARIMTAHGQMHEDELAEIMHQFVSGRIDVLLCTTIIESGLDIPNANTIIIDRADRFGLSELYQLRGRVGRYNIRAYAYLLFPRDRVLLEAARKRLRALNEFSGAGSGFKLALRDLEIRGAGNILGKEQHGHIASVGFDLYCRLLKQNVLRLKGSGAGTLEGKEIVVKLGFQPSIPVSYAGDESIRIDIYKRLGRIENEDGLSTMAAELADRFGPLPDAVRLLLDTCAIRLRAHDKRIDYLELKEGKLILRRGTENVMFYGKFARIPEKRPLDIAAHVKDILKITPNNT
jgi:transcription-repair coupling factor (superfamily II helicase)